MGKENILGLLRNGRKYTVPGKGLGYKEGQRSGVNNTICYIHPNQGFQEWELAF